MSQPTDPNPDTDAGPTSSTDTADDHAALADAFGRGDITDPLAQYVPTFETVDIDPFEVFITDVVVPNDPADDTLDAYRRAFRQWAAYMATVDGGAGRHPACPRTEQVLGFIRHRLDDHGNAVSTTKQKLTHLNRAYEYFQREPSFPHTSDFNPFENAREKASWGDDDEKEQHPFTVDMLREHVDRLTHVRDRALVVTGLKLGMRQGEVRNMRLQDVNIANAELHEHYPELGSHPYVRDYDNAIYIPSRDERDGNKSENHRTLPLDDEMRRVLIEYLTIRPDAGEPWVFLTEQGHHRIHNDHTVNHAWRRAFHPQFDETEQYEPVTSHYGRHVFSSWWKIDQGIQREYVQYMRGDNLGGDGFGDRKGLDHYLHVYYESIEQLYRENIFRLNV